MSCKKSIHIDEKNIIVQQKKKVKKNVASHFTDEEITVANTIWKKCPIFLVIKNVESKYTVKKFTTSN